MDNVVQDVPQLLSAMSAISDKFGGCKPWWRGQAVSDWNLVPAIHHRGATANEHNLTFRFRNMAKVRHRNCPPNSEISSWLFLMQHYGLPTRLLDWTESSLIALFFAVEESAHDSHDAALWALNPTQLNKKQRGKGAIYSAEHPAVFPVIRQAFDSEGEPVSHILGILTDQTDIRQRYSNPCSQYMDAIHPSTICPTQVHSSTEFAYHARLNPIFGGFSILLASPEQHCFRI